MTDEEKRSRVQAERTPAEHVHKEQEESANSEEVHNASTEEAVEEEQQTGGALGGGPRGKEDEAK